jgi:DNA-binding response OmpR family regulator
MAKILIVEDDPFISEIYQKKFIEAGFETKIATNGREVLGDAKNDSYDVILLDLVLPEMSGMEVLKELKKGASLNPATKVIIFSNLSERETQDEAFKAGADGFIPKTQFSPSELVREIQRLVGDFSEQEKNEARRNGNGNGKSETLPVSGSMDVSVSGTGEKGKILFIEDEQVFLEMFGKKLEDEGYEVEYARNGAWGLKEAMKKKFNLILIDMVMPAMSGEEMVAQLKLEGKTKDIPVLVLSASTDDLGFAKMRDLGVIDCLVKTQIVPSELVKRVNEILKK